MCKATSEALAEPTWLIYWNDALVLAISLETLNTVQTMTPAQRKRGKKMVNTLKLQLYDLIWPLKSRVPKLNTVHILQLHSEVPHLLADVEFHMSLSRRSTRWNLRSKCEVNIPAIISQHNFALPYFKKGTPSGWLFWCVVQFAGWRLYTLLLDFQKRCPMKFTLSKHILLYEQKTPV